jgi:aspartate/methionine/tyrosine aminotransferase
MKFSSRTSWDLAENNLAAAVRSAREQGTDLADLTVSNPTTCGFHYPVDLLAPLADPAAQLYTPEPFGMAHARETVALYYRDHGTSVPATDICLTTSTSEAYSFLFRLLCDPGDEVLAARPSYPLFDFIARLDDVTLRDYPLLYDPYHAWLIDLHALEAAITPRTRAIVLVHPNNPTGNFVSSTERIALQQLCLSHNLALIVDEVFLDYATHEPQPTFADPDSPCLTFVLSGISKICALPQMKCSWIVTCGPKSDRTEALARLEVIADTFLSINAPVQFALPTWLAQRHDIQQQILSRMSQNLATLDALLPNSSSERLAMHGGWSSVLRVPRTIDGTRFVDSALDCGVIVQPGDFYGLPEGRIVLSLLTPPTEWTRGLAKLPL